VDPGGFEWDPKKNRANLQKHGIDFTDGIAIFGGLCIEGPDERFDYAEARMIALWANGTPRDRGCVLLEESGGLATRRSR
jgi:uncharacterized DUF497 family protein